RTLINISFFMGSLSGNGAAVGPIRPRGASRSVWGKTTPPRGRIVAGGGGELDAEATAPGCHAGGATGRDMHGRECACHAVCRSASRRSGQRGRGEWPRCVWPPRAARPCRSLEIYLVAGQSHQRGPGDGAGPVRGPG